MKKILAGLLITTMCMASMPFTATAEESTCPDLGPGDLFKVEGNSAVYLINDNGRRMYFPNGEIYKTWYDDYANITEISMNCVAQFPIPDAPPYGVNYRPGAALVKVQISPRVYVITSENEVRPIESAEVARELYGENWATLIRDISDAYWPNYKRNAMAVENAVPHRGMMFKVAGDESETIYYVRRTSYVSLDSNALKPAQMRSVRTISAETFARLEENLSFLGQADARVYRSLRNPAQPTEQ